MRVRRIPASILAEASWTYLTLRLRRDAPKQLGLLLVAEVGRDELDERERRSAMQVDNYLRRVGVRCLWRSAVVVRMLRRRGVAATIRLAVHRHARHRAHAECEVGGRPLRPLDPDWITLS